MSLWDVVVSIFWFMLLVSWIWLLIAILGDIFGDHDLSGGSKALWALFLVVVPWVGALSYLVVRGESMNDRARARSQQNEKAFAQYVQQTAASGSPSTADELGKLAALRDRGAITPEDYEQAKAKALGNQSVTSA
jgi:hypothetical protein